MNSKPRKLILTAALILSLGSAWAGLGNYWNSSTAAMPPLGNMLDQKLIDELDLNETQQAALAQIHQQTQANVHAVQKEMQALRQRLDKELAKDVPDLRKAFEDGLEARQATVLNAVNLGRETRLDFYDSLDPEQKRMVADRMELSLTRLDRLRQFLMQLLLAR
ncbi:Spy/CpxP family protein refolding chaperone [Thiolapillus brandeum]|nr:Spy/CpxP family protein refolding chaperone [Thiolapillus brandeum]